MNHYELFSCILCYTCLKKYIYNSKDSDSTAIPGIHFSRTPYVHKILIVPSLQSKSQGMTTISVLQSLSIFMVVYIIRVQRARQIFVGYSTQIYTYHVKDKGTFEKGRKLWCPQRKCFVWNNARLSSYDGKIAWSIIHFVSHGTYFP